LVTISSPALPSSSTLYIRFRNTATTNQFRIDDVKLTGTAAAAPEINVKQSATNIADGSGSYSFGSQTISTTSSAVTFTVENTGTAALTVGTVSFSGGNASDFNVTAQPGSSVAASGTTTFTVTFTPGAIGSRSTTLTFSNGDSDENPYDFTISGTGTSATSPEINVKQAATNIADGTGTYGFTSTVVGSSSSATTFTIENTGTADLTLGTISLSGGNTGDFSVTQPLTSTVTAGNSTTFTATFSPTATGSRSSSITFSNNDSDENPYNFAVTGTGNAPACVAPANQATSLTFPTVTSNTIGGSFTAAIGGADGYLVVRSTSNTLSSGPVDGSTYTAGNSLGGGTVVSSAAGTTFTASGLSSTTQYYFFVYGYNNTACTGGPIYKAPSLTGNATTLAAPVTIATYTFTGAAGNEATLPADVPQPTGVNAGVIDRLGIVSAVAAPNTFGTANWQTAGNAIDLTRYVEFTVSPTAGYALTLTDFSFQDQISGTGPVNFALRSSKDTYAANIFSGSTNSTITDPAHTTSLSGFTTLTSGTTFRLYGYGATASGGTWRLDNIIVQGFITTTGPTLVVNPTSLAFGSVNTNTTSTQQSFTLQGVSLTNNVTITAPSGYGISLTSGGPYTSSIPLTIAQVNSAVTIYTVFQPTATGAQNGNITVVSTGATTQNVAVTGTGTVSPPVITASTTGTLAFGNVNVNTTSAEQSYTVSGANLTANLVVTASTSFAVSTVSGGPYTSSVTLTPTSGTVGTTTIYVVYKPTTNGASSSNVANTSTGATTKNVAVSGTGVTPCAVPTNQATNLTFPSIVGTTINGSFTASVGGADGYLVLRSTSSTLSTGPVDGTAYTLGSTLGGGTVISNTSTTTFSTSGNQSTQYYFFVYAFNNTGCVGGPIYKKPSLNGNATTLTALYTAFDNFNRGSNTNTVGIPSTGAASAWTENEFAASRATVFADKLVLNSGTPAGADWVTYDMTGKYATTFNNATSDLVWVFNMAATRSNPSGFLSTSNTYGAAVVLGGTDADLSEGGNGYAVVLGNSGTPDYVKVVRYTGGLMNPNNNANLTDIVVYTASTGDQDLMNIKVEYSPVTKIWKLYVNRPGGTAPFNTSGTQPAFAFPDPTAATYGAAASSAADNNSLLNGSLPYSGFLFNHATVTDEYATFDNFNIPTAQECTVNTWTGATSTDWFTASNWSCGSVPASTNDVVIPNVTGASNNFPDITGINGQLATTKDLTVNSGAHITIAGLNGVNLEIYGNMANNNGTAAFVNNGAAKVVLKGTVGQTISGSSTFKNLEVDNTNWVSISSGTQRVAGTLILKNGTLTTGGNLTIASDANGAGLVDDFSSGNTGTISGNITVERYAVNPNNGFYYIGSPVASATIADWNADFSNSPQNGANDNTAVIPVGCSLSNLAANSPYGGLFEYRENAVASCNLEGWFTRFSGAIATAHGFAGRVANGTTLNLTGTYNTGAKTSPSLTVTGTNTVSQGFNLIANPYASPLNWLSVNTGNAGKTDGAAYVYHATGAYAGTYVAINQLSGGSTLIGSSQAFFVDATTNNSTLSFANSMRSTGANGYLRTGQPYEQMLTLDVAGNGYADLARIAFGSNFTAAFDNSYDAKKMKSRDGQPNIYIVEDDVKHSIYAQPSPVQVKHIPVTFEPGANGSFTITAGELSTFDPTALVYLEDTKEGVTQNLMVNPAYTFTANVNDAAERFVLHFVPAAEVTVTGTDCAGDNGLLSVDMGNYSVNGANIVWNTYEVKASGGNVVAAGQIQNNLVNIASLPEGTYNVTLDLNGYTATVPVTVDNMEVVQAAFTPAMLVANTTQDISFANSSTGATTYTWNFGDGSTDVTANPVHQYAHAGEYEVILTAQNADCSSSYSQLLKVEEITSGIGSITDNSVNVYSNSNQININFTAAPAASFTLDVLDMMGRKVIASQVMDGMSNAYTIALPPVADGYYFVRMNTEAEVFVKEVFLGAAK
jgi:hypothetical protein